MPGTLYLVATPLGNLEDITLRAIRTLRECAWIACEDTRHTAKLTHHLGIQTRLVSLHEHNETGRAAEIIASLERGDDVAIVSDAGTPLISDPGYRAVRAVLDAGLPVCPIPGPSAAVSALSASGLATDRFVFEGFLPPKQGQRRRALEAFRDESRTVIFYEAPHRVLESISDIAEILGPDRPLVAARELTKLHEEFIRGAAAAVLAELTARPAVKGEFTLLVGPPAPVAGTTPDDEALRRAVAELVEAGRPRMDAIKEVARRHGLGKRDVYRIAGE